LERVKLFLNMETLTSRIRKSGNCPYLDNRMRYMIDAIHKHTPRFPDTVSGLRKYKRAVPPRFALSLQSSSKASQHPSKKGSVRSGSSIKKLLRRQTSEGWEQHSASVDIEKILSRTLKPSKPLHYYQKRTLMWARSLEAEVRSGVKYRIPLKYFQPEEGEALPVGFDPINQRLFLEQDSNYKRPLHFSFKGGVIANEMGLGKTLSCIALVLTDQDYSILEKGDEKQAECYEISGTGNPIIDGIYMKGENGERKDCYTKFTLRGKELTGQMRLLKDIAMGSWMIKDANKPQYKRENSFPQRGLSYVNFGVKYGDVDDIIKLNGKKCSVIKHKRVQRSRRAGVHFEEDGSEKKTMKIKRLSPTKFPLREGRTLTNATLVICPSHLAKQWKQEVTAFLHPGLKKSIKVHVVTTMPQLAKLNFDAIREADMIVVSIQLFLNPAYQKLSLTHLVDTMEHRNGVYDYLARLQQHPVIEAFFWKRIILDEGHEIFAKAIMNQKTPVMDVMMAIKSETRWYVSGTPFPDNDLTPRGALRFLRVKIDGVEVLEQEARDVISDISLMGYKQRLQNYSRRMHVNPGYGYNLMLFWTRIGSFLDHMLYSRMYCRYTTSFVKGVYKVPDYDTEIVRLAMHPYERALYEDEAMQIDRSRDTMRQLCAHPAVSCVNAPRYIRRGRGHKVREQISLDISLYLRQQASRLGNQHRMIVEEINSIRRGEDATGYSMASSRRSRGDTEILLRRYVYYENTLYPRMRLIFNLMRDEKLKGVNDSFSGFPMEEQSHYAHIIRFIKAKAAIEKRLNLQLSFREAIQLRKEERKEKSDRDLTWAQAHEDAKITETLKQSVASHRAQGTRSIYQSSHWGGYRSSFLQNAITDNYEEIEDDALPPHYSAKDFELPAIAPHMTEDAVTKNGSKITYVVSRLKQLLEEGARVILFSQWQRLFQGLQQVLDDEEIKYVLVRGNVHVRTGAIRKFNTDPDVKVIMLSLDSSASGANLQKASHVILLDPPAGTSSQFVRRAVYSLPSRFPHSI